MTESYAVLTDDGQWLHSSDVVLPIYSVTKTFTAACVMAAEVDLDERVSKWIPADLVPRAADISVAQLLYHSSGLRDYGALPEYAQAIARGELWSDRDFAQHTLAHDLLFEPGSGYAYSNPGYWLLRQILQTHTQSVYADCLAKYVLQPLELHNTRLVSGLFADDLPNYPAEWVWHGLLVSSASDVVKFMTSPLVQPLLANDQLVSVSYEHPQWRQPSSAYGLMVDPGIRYGHNGEGPGYSASCFHFLPERVTACLLTSASNEGAAFTELLHRVNSLT